MMPEGSYEYQLVDASFALYEKYPDDWRAAVREADNTLLREHYCRERMSENSVNGPIMIFGLLYGNGGLMVTELVDDIADLLVDDPEVQYKAGNSAANILPIVGKAFSGIVDVLARPTLEAALAASNVYVCGHLFLRRLQGESRMLGFDEVIAMRRKGRMDIFRGVAEALKDKCREKFGIGHTQADTPEKLKDNNVPLS